jgi:hypothetical protein
MKTVDFLIASNAFMEMLEKEPKLHVNLNLRRFCGRDKILSLWRRKRYSSLLRTEISTLYGI